MCGSAGDQSPDKVNVFHTCRRKAWSLVSKRDCGNGLLVTRFIENVRGD